jgi:hypothetical protein
MSLDMVEIALTHFTDWARFETLAVEVMRQEGYPDIMPHGGVKDEGEDAVAERFYLESSQRIRIVFQITLQDGIASKVNKTLKRLDEADKEYHKLVIVTALPISTQTQNSIRANVKASHGIDLVVFERKTFVSRLGDLGNGLLSRFFPNLQQQFEALTHQQEMRQAQASEAREEEFLRVCCACAFEPAAARTRDALFDQAVLGALITHRKPEGLSAEEVHTAFESLLPVKVESAQIAAALARLAKSGSWVSEKVGRYGVPAGATVHLEGLKAALWTERKCAIEEIVDDVCNALNEEAPVEIRARLTLNAKETLVGYFRLRGLELANSFLAEGEPVLVYSQGATHLQSIAGNGLPEQMAKLLVSAVARALANPTPAQTRFFANYARAYLAVQAMNLDPSLREFQATRFRAKTFLLDTDFVLEAVVADCPNSATYRKLVSQLLSMGAIVIVPKGVVDEVATHFAIAPRTYSHFVYEGDTLASVPPELVESRVKNVLVRGYYYKCRGGTCQKAAFMRYRENYWADEGGVGFTEEVIRQSLPGAKIEDVATFFGIDSDGPEIRPIHELMLKYAKESWLSDYRTEGQTEDLARTDALLLYAVAGLGAKTGAKVTNIFGGQAYILTSSARYLRAASKCGIKARVTTRPEIIVGILTAISSMTVDDAEFVRLFENPLIHKVAEACWSDIECLLAKGMDLRDKSITRLRYDCEQGLHRCIVEADQGGGEDIKGHIKLANEVAARGYRLGPLLERVLEAGRDKSAETAELQKENEILRAKIKQSGRKRARWLKRYDEEKVSGEKPQQDSSNT